MEAEVWIIHSMRYVLLTDVHGVPVGNGVLGDVVFVCRWTLPEMGWGQAGDIARARAAELGYALKHESGIDVSD